MFGAVSFNSLLMKEHLPVSGPPFGRLLKRWRTEKGFSQLTLATAAGTTARHVSFVETGRSRPGADLIARLAGALELSLRRQNALFLAAGLEPPFPETAIDEKEMQDFLAPLERLLAAHNPFPGCLIDACGKIHIANQAHRLQMPGAKERDPLEAAEIFYRETGPKRIENWAEVGPVMARRWTDSASRYDNQRVREIAERVRELVDVSARALRYDAPALCIRFRARQQIVSVYSATTLLVDVRDVSLEEMRLEMLFPVDEESRQFFEKLSSA